MLKHSRYVHPLVQSNIFAYVEVKNSLLGLKIPLVALPNYVVNPKRQSCNFAKTAGDRPFLYIELQPLDTELHVLHIQKAYLTRASRIFDFSSAQTMTRICLL